MIKHNYRIHTDKNQHTTIQKKIKRKWEIIYYCKNYDTATKTMAKIIKEHQKWAKLTKTQRINKILR